MKRILTAIAFFAFFVPCTSQAQEGNKYPWKTQAEYNKAFCDSFTKIISVMPNEFAGIKGKTVDNGWMAITEPTVMLPGANDGYFLEAIGESLHYKFGETTDSSHAAQSFVLVRDAMIKCLPSGWEYEQLVGPEPKHAKDRVISFKMFDQEHKNDEYKISGNTATLNWTKDSRGNHSISVNFDPHKW